MRTYKDCYNVCQGDACNNNLDVENENIRKDQNGEPVNLSCYQFVSKLESHKHYNSNLQQCPRFANWGCFSGDFTPANFDTGDKDAFNKVICLG